MKLGFSHTLGAQKPYRGTVAEIDLSAIRYNLSQLQTHVGKSRVCTVIKADAYGHGMVEVAKACSEGVGGPWGVALVEEAIALRDAGVAGEILAFDGLLGRCESEVIERNIIPVLCDGGAFERLDEAAKHRGLIAPVHVKVDVGLARLGVRWDRFESFIESVLQYRNIQVQGIMTHLSSAGTSQAMTREQIQRFSDVSSMAKRIVPSIKIVHMAGSAALGHFPETHTSWVRPGIALYGVKPTPDYPIELKPAMRWVTHIAALRNVEKGATVGYDHTFTTNRPSVIATLPVGYADGYPRLCSNRSEVLIRGKRCKVVGRVSMDLITVDVTDLVAVSPISLDEPVVLLGPMGSAVVQAEELAAWAETNVYEILTQVSYRVPRLYA